MGNTLLSIITPSFNRSNMIGQAIESVLDQDYENVEHIIIDGCSTDATLDILKDYPHLRVISEPDYGIYDALNKGVSIARGDILGFINTDDIFEANIFGTIVETFVRKPGISAVLGGVDVFTEQPDGVLKELASYSAYSPEKRLFAATIGVPLFNGWFFRNSVFGKLGKFNLAYKLASDRDFLIRFSLLDLPYEIVDKTIYHYRYHSGSATFNEKMTPEARMNYEFREIAEHYISRGNSLTGEQKQLFLDWHRKITLEQAVNALGDKKAVLFMQHSLRGSSYSLHWPLLFLREFIRVSSNYISRKLDSYI